ncbi:cupredoxin domain-containing protein [Chelativorans sp. EGI FJ00035]|uniref:Cupredoxin domain-containing protein n=2 Tax=Chelativorans salis TaxID=2978478 RepID=A0ABT2LKX2_9HYPH|nr:cupredoxin domain-containing protein [Chelativorans sp. EGI FJ00035]
MHKSPLSLAAVVFLVAPHALAAEHTVTMAGSTYEPARINAAVGDTIRFVNDDTATHDVFVPTAGYALDLGAQEPGEEIVLTLRKAGAFEVECVFHSHMLTVVEVE